MKASDRGLFILQGSDTKTSPPIRKVGRKYAQKLQCVYG